MLKKTLSKSRLSPDTLDKVKMGVMLPWRAHACQNNEDAQTPLASLHLILSSESYTGTRY